MAKKKAEEILGVGRRKTAVASVRIRKGNGEIQVNGKKIFEYFPLSFQRNIITSPLKLFNCEKKYDLMVRVKGGGLEAQAVAIRLGISRALVTDNDDLKGQLKDLGYLTRDARKKERKKYGLAGARKRFQFSKR
ncbi:MAG: 30S ribosomal protein S9 [Chlamydiae bacterium RIFCSPHIGHO2_12_FULL_27_8]|nr:MAG: 30S ribosomal protein S9 [Chlamydiae bacterium RIFCSPHIGHO2_12_FULL_27_8]OGN64755.1 MAG: 30S ribosomal protein S9 [Chlamydiae bacterium RIFCSPLOWO2_01_FULL_28_7]